MTFCENARHFLSSLPGTFLLTRNFNVDFLPWWLDWWNRT